MTKRSKEAKKSFYILKVLEMGLYNAVLNFLERDEG